MTLPHTYTDSRNDVLKIGVLSGHMCIQARETFGGTTHRATVYAPKGADAVALAKAVLEAAGDTGHRVVSEEHIKDLEAAAGYVAARSMRERAARLIEYGPALESLDFRASKIRALPLLPDA